MPLQLCKVYNENVTFNVKVQKKMHLICLAQLLIHFFQKITVRLRTNKMKLLFAVFFKMKVR